MSIKDTFSRILEKADIRINGNRTWDIVVHNEDLYGRVLRQGTLGAGEAYMDGWWDCERLDEMFCRALRGGLDKSLGERNLPTYALKACQAIFNMQNLKHAFDVANTHYNFDNRMFETFLGPSMNYSCAYWREAHDLDSAQNAKMDLICRKLGLEKGLKVLDIGCGWGALARFMSEEYGADVTGISVSKEQIAYARQHDPGQKVKWILDDYRKLDGKYDRVVSVGMFEHVGYKNYGEFMKRVRAMLNDDGLFLLHTIGANHQRKGTDPWIDKYIFPNGMLPGQASLTNSFVDLFIMEDWQNFGADYDRTLMAWHERFEDGCDRDLFSHDEKMRRMFRYYLLSCAAAFRARDIQLWQVVLSPRGVPGGYLSQR